MMEIRFLETDVMITANLRLVVVMGSEKMESSVMMEISRMVMGVMRNVSMKQVVPAEME